MVGYKEMERRDRNKEKIEKKGQVIRDIISSVTPGRLRFPFRRCHME